jgi:DNA-binding IclR family transcriptional regulator
MDLSLGARECWRMLEAFPPGKCYPSHYHIAEKLRKSESAARRYLAELKRLGYIEIVFRFDASRSKRAPRGQTSNSYTLLDQPDLIARARQIVQDWAAKRKKQEG